MKKTTFFSKLLWVMILLLGIGGNRIQAQSITKLTLSPSENLTLQVGKTQPLSVTITPDNPANKNLKWESSHPDKVRIVKSNNEVALIKAQDIGEATITVKAQDGSNVSVSINVKVVRLIEKIVLLPPGALVRGAQFNLLHEIMPHDATNKTLLWHSSAPNLVSVSAQGRITTHNLGTATVTATAQDGSTVTESVTIRVIEPVTKVTINEGDFTLKETQSKKLTVTISPADAPIRTVIWSSENPAIATVDQTGFLRAKTPGEVKIKAISNDPDAGGIFGVIKVTVIPYNNVPPPPAHKPVTDVQISEGNQNLTVNQEKQLTAVITPADATNRKVSWSSNQPNVATVSQTGLVKAVGAGEAVITVKTEDQHKTAQIRVKVTAPAPPPAPSVTEVKLDPTVLNLTAGQKGKLKATVLPAAALNREVTWSSNNEAVASVDDDGEVHAYKAGEAVITVTTKDGGKTARATVKVTGASVAVASISLDQSQLNLTAGQKGKLKATVLPLDATNREVTWSSNNEAVASVDDDGEVHAYKAGEAVITVTTKDGGKTARATVKVTGASVAVASISLDQSQLNLTAGQKGKLKATVLPLDATNREVTWSSNNEAVASVDDDGEVHAYKSGEAVITVTTKDGGKTATCKVTVMIKMSNEVIAGEASAWSSYGRLYVTSPVKEVIEIYALTGVIVHRATKSPGETAFDLNVPRGIVIVKGSSGWVRKVKL
ncbi:Ig-like domain-containing protein [Tannerella forsythia]|uniref:Ig domain-containing protein n=1 Tax=Tannerella forsythia TaxID=28112 RepID=A0A3P1YLX6_TANFO|nr:Ig-like domain-containing protein [Tannerella forsythia]RRD72041.1 Ig domain-containing protein [Tannerella forsythia]